MPKLATGASSAAARATTSGASGFTLVEVLVVVIIAGVLTGAVLLVAGPSGPAQIQQRTLARLDVSLEAMCDRALLSGKPHGLRFNRDGYDFWQLQASAWQPLPPDSRPRAVRWPEDLRPRVQVENLPLRSRIGQRSPQVICSGIEPPTPFVIEVGSGEYRQRMSWPE